MAAESGGCDFGWRASDFRLVDTTGETWDLDRIGGENGVVLVFICNHCPYVRAIADKLVREAEALKAIGVNMAAICSNDAVRSPADGYEAMGAFALQHRFTFPYLHDADQSVARAYGAECTPDFFGFNANRELQYRGRLDDAGRSPNPPAQRDLFEAMRVIAETGQGPEAQTPSIGCSIKWKAA